MLVRSVIMERVAMVAVQQGKHLAPLTDDLRLLDSGLDSLCIAIIVANLDDELGLDPLSSDEQVAFPVTLGDFIRLYENATAAA
jgi:acyl carrier protein